jgi:uncharacterized protein YcaQ
LTPTHARRIALAAQGFNDPLPVGEPDVRAFRRALDRMAVLQLDSVNVVCRSHFLPMLSRLGSYDRDRLDRWLWFSGENLEYLAHEASLTSVHVHRHLRFRMRSGRWKAGMRLEKEEPQYLAAVANEIAERGELSVSDLSDPGDRTGPWWGHSKGKLALEWLYVTGRLAIHHRTNTFLTLYDLPERVVPHEIRALPDLDDATAMKELLMLAARSHGVGTDRDLADYFRLRMPVARPLLAELVEEGSLDVVEIDGWNEPALLHPRAKRPRGIDRATLLSPFDPVVWFRPRAERLFGFRYRIEIYVPEAKREFGYYVLPFLFGDELVGRVDLKADRKRSVLMARGVFAEEGRKTPEVASALATALLELAAFLDLDGVEVGGRGNLANGLRKELG